MKALGLITAVALLVAAGGTDAMSKDKNTALIDAAAQCRLGEVKKLLRQGANVDAQNEHGWTPLAAAAQYDCPEVAGFLLARGADLRRKVADEYTPLDRTIVSGVSRVARLLFENENSTYLSREYGMAPLAIAACKNDLSTARRLVSSGADPDHQDERGATALSWSSWLGYQKMARLLLNSGATVDIQEKDGRTALMQACLQGHLPIVRVLLDAGSQVNFRSGPRSALSHASFAGRHNVVKLLLKRGANPNLHPRTMALNWACAGGNLEIAKTLLAADAEINGKDKDGDTPLMQSCLDGNLELVKWLIDSGADVHVRNNADATALVRTCQAVSVEAREAAPKILELLINKGADVNARDVKGKTPLILACAHGRIEPARILLARGAYVNATDDRGWTPLMMAAADGDAKIVKVLLAGGADPKIATRDGLSALDLARDGEYADISDLLSKATRKQTNPRTDKKRSTIK